MARMIRVEVVYEILEKKQVWNDCADRLGSEFKVQPCGIE